ncbi:hypothetical protein [Streptomyces flavochromogenes]|uniref:hypothetical protein n=1 Tax=Streptomyces flavochromogenes TaxID=68199 RepID=UPI0004C01A80|nr:hypothetical protein [Streptomyces flavochromogenes]
MYEDFGDSDESDDLRAEIARSRKAERVGWVAIAAVLALVVVVVLAVIAGVLLFSVAAVSVN